MTRKRAEILLTLPSLAWLAAFVLVPMLIIFVIAFRRPAVWRDRRRLERSTRSGRWPTRPTSDWLAHAVDQRG